MERRGMRRVGPRRRRADGVALAKTCVQVETERVVRETSQRWTSEWSSATPSPTTLDRHRRRTEGPGEERGCQLASPDLVPPKNCVLAARPPEKGTGTVTDSRKIEPVLVDVRILDGCGVKNVRATL